MDSAGLSDEHASRSLIERSARDRRGRGYRSETVRPGGVHVRQAGPTPATAAQAVGEVEPAATVAEAADQRQADYFLRLLSQNRRVIEHRIEGYHKAIASADASGNTEGAYGLRRMARIDEREREMLSGLIENLHRRFPARTAAEVPAVARRSRVAAR